MQKLHSKISIDYLGKTFEELNHLLNSTDSSLQLSDSIIIKGIRESMIK